MHRLSATLWSMTIALGLGLLFAAAPADAKTLTVVMHSSLRVLDPIITTAQISRDHGYMIYDTLLALDSDLKVRPQMADWKVSDDRLTYTFTLRDGLKWHDGPPVTAEDCVASLRRWGQRDSMGQKLMDFTASLEATDAKTITLRLKEPYGQVLESIAKPSYNVPFMMPKRMAETPADRPVPEQIGSGPFRFVTSEFQPGVKAVYEKNTDYVPRSEPPSWTAGGKVVKVDRVEWVTMPDSQTALSALQSGEIDVFELPPADLIPIMQADKNIEVSSLSAFGSIPFGRMNFLYPPFDNVKLRRAAFLALNEKDVLDAIVGNPKYYKLCGAIFGCGTRLDTDAGSETLVKGSGMAAAKRLLAESNYDGSPVVLMGASDISILMGQATVAAQLLREAGFKVELVTLDWQTIVGRRAVQRPPKEGGWSMFFSIFGGVDVLDPLVNIATNGRGRNNGWFGWYEDGEMEKLRDDFSRAVSADEQKRIARDIQIRAYDQVAYIPFGYFDVPSAWRKSVKGLLPGAAIPVFWNVEKAD
ncbi:MAG: extracellular solute-binding protein family 5 [Tardiphaga sp.]|nr:extracellular solute-binding protein family 5 [Tardiphaga sp.]